MVVNHYGEMVCDETVAPLDNEIAGFRFQSLRYLTLQSIREGKA